MNLLNIKLRCYRQVKNNITLRKTTANRLHSSDSSIGEKSLCSGNIRYNENIRNRRWWKCINSKYYTFITYSHVKKMRMRKFGIVDLDFYFEKGAHEIAHIRRFVNIVELYVKLLYF